MIFPWQQTIWSALWQRKQNNCLPHALLFSGIQGVGKSLFAKQFSEAIFCLESTPEGQSCGQCRSCNLMRAGSHPDFLNIEPQEEGHMIKIDQIRDVVQFVNETTFMSGYRIIIINPANAMNINAANALLKTLEEPTPQTLIILMSGYNAKLPATILSRCQRIHFSKPENAAALHWLKENSTASFADLELALKLAYGAPLKAKEFLENDFLQFRQEFYQGLYELSQRKCDPLSFAAKFQEKNLENLFNLLFSWLNDLLRIKLKADLHNIDCKHLLNSFNVSLSWENLLCYIDYIYQLHIKILSSLNLNRQLLLEEILIRWMKICF